MNGRIERPPEKGKSYNTLPQDDESIYLNGIEIKQEPIVKSETENTVNMVTVSASKGASGSIAHFIDADFTDVCELAEAKSEVKIDEEAKNSSADVFAKSSGGMPSSSSDAKNFRSNRKQLEAKRGLMGSINMKRSVMKKQGTPNTNIRSNKKKPTASKGMGKQHKCSSCDYTTSQKGNLNKHIRKHTGEKPFPCIHCAKRFTQKVNLQRHMRTHVSEFLFSCSNCLIQSQMKTELSNFFCFFLSIGNFFSICLRWSSNNLKTKIVVILSIHFTR